MKVLALDTFLEFNNTDWLKKSFVASHLFPDETQQQQDMPANQDFEILWTSGVACSKKDPGKKTGKCTTATWCSTKTVSKLKYALSPSEKLGGSCLALDYKVKQLKVTDCIKKGIVFCEVSRQFLYLIVFSSKTVLVLGFIFHVFLPYLCP